MQQARHPILHFFGQFYNWTFICFLNYNNANAGKWHETKPKIHNRHIFNVLKTLHKRALKLDIKYFWYTRSTCRIRRWYTANTSVLCLNHYKNLIKSNSLKQISAEFCYIVIIVCDIYPVFLTFLSLSR